MPDEGPVDIVVVGAGLGGMATAVRATELGLRVVVLEKSREEVYVCNSRITGGVFHVGMDNILLPPKDVRGIIERVTYGHARPELADVLANNAGRAVAWLRTQGIKFIKGPTPDMSALLSPPKLAQFGLHWEGRAGDVLLRTLGQQLTARGGKIIRGTRAIELILSGESCVGVLAEVNGKETQFLGGAVVLADGGFQANLEMVGKYISPAPEKVFQRNARTGNGDGIRMAEKIGANLVDLDRFYGHVLHREAFRNDNLWPYPMIDVLALAGIVVDRAGARFADEGRGGIYLANKIAGLADPLSTAVVFDEVIWNGPGKGWILTPNPNVVVAGGSIVEASTLDDLAQKAGIDSAGLKKTVADHNERVANGSLAGARPVRTTSPHQAFPIEMPPFKAIPLCAGITYTMGGIAIDGHGRALTPDSQPIPGLFAVGACTGGLEGGEFAGYTGGLSKASTFGLLAAEFIAREHSRLPA